MSGAALSKTTHVSDLRPSDSVEALLRELVAGQREIIALLSNVPPAHILPPASRDNRVFLALTASVDDKAFSARELRERADLLDGELRAALAAAGLVNGRKIGKYLRSVEGQTIAGLRLERIGTDHDGIVWRVWRVSNSQTQTADCGDADRGA
jgi:hypothetical protein